MLITKEIEIDAAHRVTNHKSKCRSNHGHRYRIEVGVDDKVITTRGSSDEGMVIDYGDLKELMMEELDKRFDHGTILWSEDPLVKAMKEDTNTKLTVVDFIPTAENLAKYWFDLMKSKLEARSIKIKHVKVWETPSSSALYEETNKL